MVEKQEKCKAVGDYCYPLEGTPIGKGAFATVYKGSHVDDPKDVVAIKVINAQTIQEYKDFAELFDRETEILLKVKGPHIVEVKKILKTGSGNLYIVTAFCEGGSLEQKLTREGKLPESEALKIVKGVCEAFIEIESLNLKNEKGEKMMVMHRDIKPGNILFQNGVIKLADFGFAKLIEVGKKNIKTNHTHLGSPSYMSPQILEQVEYSGKCDIWSLGIMLFEMVMGKLPWPSCSIYELLQNMKGNSLNISQSVSKECRDLIEKMLKFEESVRIDWKGILEHPAITGKKLLPEETMKVSDPKSKIKILSSTSLVKPMKISQADETSEEVKKENKIPAEVKTSQRNSSGIQILSISKSNASDTIPPPQKKSSKITFIE